MGGGDKEKRKRGGGGRGGGRQDSSETFPITRAQAGRSCAWIHLSGAEIKTAEGSAACLTPPASLKVTRKRGTQDAAAFRATPWR